VVGIGRSTTRYRPASRADEPASRGRLRELALERRRFGYRRLHVLLAREGVAVNHKRVERLYRDEGLTVRRGVAPGRQRSPTPQRPRRPDTGRGPTDLDQPGDDTADSGGLSQ
jgi:putative transposase